MAKKKSTRKPRTQDHDIVAPSVRGMAKKTKAAKRKRQPTEDFNQIAARIRRETENK
jgi:hypothetical protein